MKVIGENLLHLKELDLSQCNISDASVQYFSFMKDLERLMLLECQNITDKSMAHLCLPNLMAFGAPPSVTSKGLIQLSSRLTVLDLFSNLDATLENLPKLSQLENIR
jgi:hypothetical protein